MNIVKTIFGYLLITFLVCGYAHHKSPDLKFEHIGREQGLTADLVLCLLQDHVVRYGGLTVPL